MKRQRGLSMVLLVGGLFIVAAVLWRGQLLALRERREAAEIAERTARISAGGETIAWRPATEAETQKGKAAVEGQLDAFKQDDYEKAVTYQSVGLKGVFPSVEAFRQMMKQNYPDFASCQKIEFEAAQADEKGENLMLPARVTGPTGITVSATYYLSLEDGEYRVAGVDGGGRPLAIEPEGTL